MRFIVWYLVLIFKTLQLWLRKRIQLLINHQQPSLEATWWSGLRENWTSMKGTKSRITSAILTTSLTWMPTPMISYPKSLTWYWNICAGRIPDGRTSPTVMMNPLGTDTSAWRSPSKSTYRDPAHLPRARTHTMMFLMKHSGNKMRSPNHLQPSLCHRIHHLNRKTLFKLVVGSGTTSHASSSSSKSSKQIRWSHHLKWKIKSTMLKSWRTIFASMLMTHLFLLKNLPSSLKKSRRPNVHTIRLTMILRRSTSPSSSTQTLRMVILSSSGNIHLQNQNNIKNEHLLLF